MLRLVGLCLLLSIPPLALGGADPNDPKNWTPVRIPGRQKAPEFEDIADWVNSEPVTMNNLKGKVVVVHFMAFG